jgi:hypothetical protein
MSLYPNASSNATGALRHHARRLCTTAAALVVVSLLVVTAPSGAAPHFLTVHAKRERVVHAEFPVGIRDAAEPSGIAPPPANALRGYWRSYTTDFGGTALPAGWGPFAGIPMGDDQSSWLPSHVVVSGGLVRLISSKSTAGQWVTGGIGQFDLSRSYGAYFVRSRVTGPGPDQNEMLWPAAPVWPPEVDFN